MLEYYNPFMGKQYATKVAVQRNVEEERGDGADLPGRKSNQICDGTETDGF
jgi:hypothetical protein